MYDDLEQKVDWDLSIYLCFPRKKDGEELISFSRIKNPKIHFVFLNRKHCSGLAPSWRHYLYKKGYPLEYGQRLRCEYEQGQIRTEKDFTEVLYNDLLGRQE
jgi:hypothetical protein